MPKRRKKINLAPIMMLLMIITILTVAVSLFLYNTLPSFTYEIWPGTKMTTGDYFFLGMSQVLYLTVWIIFWWDHKKSVRKYYVKKAMIEKRRAQA